MGLSSNLPVTQAQQVTAAPAPPALSYAGVGVPALKKTRQLQAQGSFDKAVLRPLSALQSSITAFTAPKTLIGG